MSEAAAIGECLRTARERRGLGVVQAAERLHVDAAVIEALEAGRFTALGAPVFVRGHLRRYAELLGEADGPLQMRYAALQEAATPPDLTQTSIRPAALARTSTPRWPLVAVAVALVLGIVIWWALRSPAS
jgi:cytoskeleton protein RodZ